MLVFIFIRQIKIFSWKVTHLALIPKWKGDPGAPPTNRSFAGRTQPAMCPGTTHGGYCFCAWSLYNGRDVLKTGNSTINVIEEVVVDVDSVRRAEDLNHWSPRVNLLVTLVVRGPQCFQLRKVDRYVVGA